MYIRTVGGSGQYSTEHSYSVHYLSRSLFTDFFFVPFSSSFLFAFFFLLFPYTVHRRIIGISTWVCSGLYILLISDKIGRDLFCLLWG